MPKQPLFPHIPKKKEPLFPHVPKGQQRATMLPSPRYEFFPESVRRRLPPLGATGEEKDPIVQVKFFTPWTNWTWYGIEFDGEDTFFGWVVGLEKEFGSFSLAELQSVRGPGGLKIERDIYFDPKPISQVMKEHGETLAMTIPKETAYKVFRVSDGKLVFAGNKKDALREFKRLGGTKAGYRFFYTTSETMPEIQSMPATKLMGDFILNQDRMGNIIITYTVDIGKSVFLQFEADKELVYDILTKDEAKDLDAGWRIEIRDDEPRATMLQELWEVSAQAELSPSVQFLPQIAERVKQYPILEELTKEVCYDFRAVRSAVMRRAWEIMDTERVRFGDAIKSAWDEVKRQCWKLGAVV